MRNINLTQRHFNLRIHSRERVTHQVEVHLYLPSHFRRSQTPQVLGIPMLVVVHPTSRLKRIQTRLKNFAFHDSVARGPAYYARTHTYDSS